MRFIVCGLALAMAISLGSEAFAEKNAQGSVLEYAGEVGELVVSRDGVVYPISVGADLFAGDIVRARRADTAIILFDGCRMELPEGQDVFLNNEFCSAFIAEDKTMAMAASENISVAGSGVEGVATNAPLIVGGVVLSAGGIAATTGGGAAGTSSTSSVQSGVPAGSPSTPG